MANLPNRPRLRASFSFNADGKLVVELTLMSNGRELVHRTAPIVTENLLTLAAHRHLLELAASDAVRAGVFQLPEQPAAAELAQSGDSTVGATIVEPPPEPVLEPAFVEPAEPVLEPALVEPLAASSVGATLNEPSTPFETVLQQVSNEPVADRAPLELEQPAPEPGRAAAEPALEQPAAEPALVDDVAPEAKPETVLEPELGATAEVGATLKEP